MKVEAKNQDVPGIIIKRNNDAPDFTDSLVNNRIQLLIEGYIQYRNIDLQEYIDDNKILNLLIPLEDLREWYPGPNWKKDIARACRAQMSKREEIETGTGDFEMINSLLAYAKLSDEGLLLSIIPKILQYYLVKRPTSYTILIEYSITARFLSKYSHQIYWELCKHDNPEKQYSFFITPEQLNKIFKTKYKSASLGEKVLSVSQAEILQLYKQNLAPRYYTFTEKREVIGKCKKIVGWEVKIHNAERKNRELEKAKDAYEKIVSILEKYIPQYKLNILNQLKGFNSEKIIHIWMRLEKFELSDKQQIKHIPAYLCNIISHYDINPYAKKGKKAEEESIGGWLFKEEEDLMAIGLSMWLKAYNHINESKTLTNDVKKLFGEVKFWSYEIVEGSHILTLRLSRNALYYIKTYYESGFINLLKKYFPNDLSTRYYAV